MMEPFEIDPMAMIQAQQQRIAQLTNENVQLNAAVLQLQQELARDGANEKSNGEVIDVTDEVVGAEMNPRAEITS